MQHGKVIVYASRQLREYEFRYPTHDLELAAIVFALKVLEALLVWKEVRELLNHKSIRYAFPERT